MWKISGNVFLVHLGGWIFHVSQGCSQSWGVRNDTFENFCGLFYNIEFQPYAASKMELFVT